MLLFLCLAFFCLYLYFYFVIMQHPAKFPPGPKKLFPFLPDKWGMDNVFLIKHSLRPIHGDIIGYWNNFSTRRVVLNTYDLIHEASRKCEFADRPEVIATFGKKGLNGTANGIVRNSGPAWSEQRRFTLHALKNLGLGNGTMEAIITEETSTLCDYLKTQKSEVIDNLREVFYPVSVNTIWRLVASERFDREDQKLKDLMSCIDKAGTQRDKMFALVWKYWPFNQINHVYKIVPTTRDVFDELTKFCLDAIKKHESSLQADCPRDYIDLYLQKISEESALPEFSTFKGQTGRMNLATILGEIILAGADINYNALLWGMYFMILHPEAQKRVQNEIDKVTGGTRLPCTADKKIMPYTEAVILEIFRKASLFPVTFHASRNGGYLDHGNYYIPAKTAVCLNFASVAYDPEKFKNPGDFKPERYLDSEGLFHPDKNVIAFGLGKRRCPGEFIARMQVFLFITAILSTFALEKCDNDTLTGKRIHRINVGPESFRIRLIPRN